LTEVALAAIIARLYYAHKGHYVLVWSTPYARGRSHTSCSMPEQSQFL